MYFSVNIGKNIEAAFLRILSVVLKVQVSKAATKLEKNYLYV